MTTSNLRETPCAHPMNGTLTQDLRGAEVVENRFELNPITRIPTGSLVRAKRCTSQDLRDPLYMLTILSGDLSGQCFAVEAKAFEDAFRTGDMRPELAQ